MTGPPPGEGGGAADPESAQRKRSTTTRRTGPAPARLVRILGDVVAGAAGAVVTCMLYDVRNTAVVRVGATVLGVGLLVWAVSLAAELRKGAPAPRVPPPPPPPKRAMRRAPSARGVPRTHATARTRAAVAVPSKAAVPTDDDAAGEWVVVQRRTSSWC